MGFTRRNRTIDLPGDAGTDALDLLRTAMETGARKIHLVPRSHGLVLYGRIEGRLEEVDRLDGEIGRQLLEELERGMRDGVGLLQKPEEKRILKYRLETCADSMGFRYVVTPLPAIREKTPGNLSELQVHEPLRKTLADFSKARSGLFITAAPLRNGRRQTIQGIAGEIESDHRLVLDVEWSGGVRSITHPRPTVYLDPARRALAQLDKLLRLDVDALVLPEITCSRTARLALTIAKGGHLVMAPIAALDSRDALEKLCDLIPDRAGLASTLHGILSQRRLARPCGNCAFRVKRVPDHPGLPDSDLNVGAMRTRGAGCPACEGTGFEGWTYIFEHLPVSGHMAEEFLLGSDTGRPFIASAITLPGPGLLEAGWGEVKIGGLDTDEFRQLYGNVGTRAPRVEIDPVATVHRSPASDRIEKSRPDADRTVSAAACPPPKSLPREKADPANQEIEDPETVYARAREIMIQLIFPALLQEQPAESFPLTELAMQIVRNTSRSNGLLARALRDRRERDSIEHQFNVAVIASAIGQEIGWDRERLLEVAATALIHDAGKFKADGKTAEEDRPLSEIGAERVKKTYTDLPGMANRIRQIDERRDGSGSPRGLSGDEIDPVAQLIGLADTLENLHHPVKPNCFQHTFDIIHHLMKEEKNRFDPMIFQAMVQRVSLFPVGSIVRLNDGSTARVVTVNSNNFYRPKVAVIETEGGALVESRSLLDLGDSPFVYITGAEPLPDCYTPNEGTVR